VVGVTSGVACIPALSYFHRLGRDRVGIFVGDKDKKHIKQFVNRCVHGIMLSLTYLPKITLPSKRDQVLVIGYEKLRTVINELTFCKCVSLSGRRSPQECY
jgi:DNA repair and recombination protein RAD54B